MRAFAIQTLLAAGAIACGGAQQNPSRERATMPATPWTVTYADGAANVYTFSRAEPDGEVAFAYDPVTPERSSTGHYSGGDPVTRRLGPRDPRVEELWRRVEALEADREVHVPDRNKGTGAFHIRTPDGEREFIVEQGAALDGFHELVTGFR